jgi:Asp-tRNA(Asn)/Glu-tRNA(Gln) amidotransferase A subunit family amidase
MQSVLFEEHAQVVAAESRLNGRVPPIFGAASGGPCASEELRVEQRRRFLAFFASAGLSSTLLPGALWAQAQSQGANKITLDMLKAAETIAGLEFTDAERELLIDGVNQHLTHYQRLRAIPLANSVPSSLRFSPVLPGMKFDRTRRPMRMTLPHVVRRPANLEDAAFWPVTQLARLIRTRQVRSVELTGMYLERLKRYDPTLKFVITPLPEVAMEQAKRADAEIAAGKYRGPLHGIPWGAKDLISKAGYKTTWGAAPFQNQSFDYDATIVKRLEDAGAVLLAKLSTGELAGGDRWFGGQTKNPWKPEEGSSGSSAGPASATAAGCVGFAIGTETGGSIVGPSTRCAVYGMRPTYGRVSRYGVMTLAWSLDKAGPLCRGVEDCALVLNALQGPDDKDLTVTDVPFNWDATLDVRRLRVGYVKAAFDEPRAVAEEKANDAAMLEKLRAMGVVLQPIGLPEFPIRDLMSIMETEFSAAFDDLTRSNRDDLLARQGRGSDANLYRTNRFVPAVEYLQATRWRTLLMEEMEKTLKDIDVYLMPISSGRSGVPGSLMGVNTSLTNLTGHPGIVVRNGLNAQGIPTSAMFIGRIYGEAAMLGLAHAYQTATGWHLKHPVLA